MDSYWSNGKHCVHPKELEEIHMSGVCSALGLFLPKKQCSDGFDERDADEATLKKVIDDRYKTYKSNNDNANKSAVLMAFNNFTNAIDATRRQVAAWLFGTIILAAIDPATLIGTAVYGLHNFNRDKILNGAKEKAIQVFYNQRRAGKQYNLDPYRNQLNEMMDDYAKTIK